MSEDDGLGRAARRAPTPRIDSTFVRALTRGAIRAMPIARVRGARITRRTAHGVPLRLYHPRSLRPDSLPRPALLWMHGGGYVIGHPRQDDYLCRSIAVELDCIVASPDYRLAPRDPFPAALDDCTTAWRWLIEARHGLAIDPARVVLGGQSAGGGLAAGLALRIRDGGGVQPRGVWLFAPMLDDRTATRRELDDVGHAVWNNRLNRQAWRAYLSTEPGSESVSASAAPARETDLSDLPPTWIGIGDLDLFHDEVVDFAERLRASGSSSDITTVPNGFHGFERLASRTAAAQAYLADAISWLGTQLRPPTAG